MGGTFKWEIYKNVKKNKIGRLCWEICEKKKNCPTLLHSPLQAVATWDLKFIDVSVGWPGSMHDSRIYRNSSLSQAIRVRLEGTDFHILGDTVRNKLISFIERLFTFICNTAQ